MSQALMGCHEKDSLHHALSKIAFLFDSIQHSSMCGSRGGQGVRTLHKKSQKYSFFSNTGPDPLKNHKAAKLTFNVGPSSARQRNAI